MKSYFIYPNIQLDVPTGVSIHHDSSWVFNPPKGSIKSGCHALTPEQLCFKAGIEQPIRSTIPNLPAITINKSKVTLCLYMHKHINLSWKFEKDSVLSFSAAVNEALKTKKIMEELKGIAFDEIKAARGSIEAQEQKDAA